MTENFQDAQKRKDGELPPLSNMEAGAKEIAKLIEQNNQKAVDERLLQDRSCLSAADFRQFVGMINADLKKDAESMNTTLPRLELGPEQYTAKLELVSNGAVFGSKWPNKHDVTPRQFDKWAAAEYDDYRDYHSSAKSCTPGAADKAYCQWLKDTYKATNDKLPIELRLE